MATWKLQVRGTWPGGLEAHSTHSSYYRAPKCGLDTHMAQHPLVRAHFIHTLGPRCVSSICAAQPRCRGMAAAPAAHAAPSPLMHRQHMHNKKMATLHNMPASGAGIPACSSAAEGDRADAQQYLGRRTCGRSWCKGVA